MSGGTVSASPSSVLAITNGWYLSGPEASGELVQQDLVAEDGVIVELGPGVARTVRPAENVVIVDATDRLVLPGFINAHYHSHDVLAKGTMEEEPLEWWALRVLPPSFPPRSPEELRVRTLLGALECLRSGMTTVQDMVTLSPFDPAHLDVVVDAYRSIGIRAVVGPQYADRPGLATRPFWEEVIPARYHSSVTSFAEPDPDFDLLDHLEQRYFGATAPEDLVQWALAPTAPDSCTGGLLKRTAELADKYSLPVFTHLLESKSMAVAARHEHAEHGGSIVNWLRSVGLVGPRVNLAHSVWLLDHELDTLAETDTKIVLNLLSNLKLKSGVPPVEGIQQRGISYALGCDNPSCSDSQNMFQAMKLTATLASISNPEPIAPQAYGVFEAATQGGARAIGREESLGLLAPGYRADCFLVDLHDPSWLPLNSAIRQLVYSESGRGVETVVVDGEVVIDRGRSTRIDEAALRSELAAVMPTFLADFRAASSRVEEIRPYLLEAHRRVWAENVQLNRMVGG
jgi:5-methylthioadenosine/S-adenosylhomocysteine deaminase